jgi:hypothetical protein
MVCVRINIKMRFDNFLGEENVEGERKKYNNLGDI